MLHFVLRAPCMRPACCDTCGHVREPSLISVAKEAGDKATPPVCCAWGDELALLVATGAAATAQAAALTAAWLDCGMFHSFPLHECVQGSYMTSKAPGQL
jgi:hypothetical protein